MPHAAVALSLGNYDNVHDGSTKYGRLQQRIHRQPQTVVAPFCDNGNMLVACTLVDNNNMLKDVIV